jgi:ABC-type lipoprotein export system ATPase subunit
VTDPQVVIADEPTASVDIETKQVILETFKHLQQEGKVLMVATHDPDLLEQADQFAKLSSHH